MKNYFIILAAGKSKRFKSNIPKPYHLYRGKALILHSINRVKSNNNIKKILLVVNKKHKKFLKKLNTKNITIIEGGKTRAESSFIALKFIKKQRPTNVLIHDAARPNFSSKLVNKIINELRYFNCVVPTIKTNDSVKLKKGNNIINLDRRNVYMTQTPQGFNFKELYKLQDNVSSKITDDANLFIDAKQKIKLINGEIKNKKITFNNDLKHQLINKFGIGFDVHKLVPNKKLYLGGVKIPFSLGTLGHSDGDPVLHAIIDSILGACNMGDIGEKFSDKNKKFKNIRSTILLKKIIKDLKKKDILINNLDINIITQKPKIKKYKKEIINCIAKLCEILPSQINIKGKTTEKLGVIGNEKAIACEVIASVIKYD